MAVSEVGARSWNRTVGYVLGATYLAVGLIGFAVTSGVDFAASDGDHLLGIFELNPLHNVVHLLVGAMLFGGAMAGERTARGVNVLVGSVYLLVGIVGLWLVGRPENILAINHPDNLLHFGSAAVLLAVGLLASSTTRMMAGRDTHASDGSLTGRR